VGLDELGIVRSKTKGVMTRETDMDGRTCKGGEEEEEPSCEVLGLA